VQSDLAAAADIPTPDTHTTMRIHFNKPFIFDTSLGKGFLARLEGIDGYIGIFQILEHHTLRIKERTV
jgi:hypothetical protein